MSTTRRDWLKVVASFATGAVLGAAGGYYAGLQSIKTAVEKTTTSPTVAEAPKTQIGLPKMKIHFIYVGPVGDYGWTYAHEQGRIFLEKTLCPDPDKWCIVETSKAEEVKEEQAYSYVKNAVSGGAHMVITTSYGFMDGTKKAAAEHPDRFFAHCSGYFKDQQEWSRLQNFAEYFIDLYEAYYLNGIVAGKMTKTNRLGYVAAFPKLPEIIRHMNAFLIGAREVNPNVQMDVVGLGAWYAPENATRAAQALVDINGVDVLAFTEDTPAVLRVAEDYQKQGKKVWSFSHYSDMSQYGPNANLTGQIVNWGPLYVEMAIRAYLAWISGELSIWSEWPPERPRDYWWSMKNSYAYYDYKKNPTDILPLNPAVPDEVRKYVEERRRQIIEGVWDPFTGPVRDMQGKVRVPDRTRLSKDELYNMDWYVEGYRQLPP
ncbi:putative ABC-type transport system, periplasmic component/surface lipoprotein [Pyrobaculum oguniense TE7]|uniref:ABC-type transport system, periplasmic component/surface lipoprotein n=1 Tax=Pyrobaculum oguniense (strain DSM 13380 / JCM 10595 / TE7) TaxID=698757 RepID=H6Q8L8_PYROT|nr:putative ABC-type transport system, periplasmic component/surface lipoprotein [Pyrobaculum oguniense TE7]